MSKMQSMLEERFSSSKHSKVKALAKQSNEGSLSSFHGLFKASELPKKEVDALHEMLEKFCIEPKADSNRDFQELVQITSEVRAINNQAAILHGERIMRAQKILKSYREGAFSAWLITAYGNRQTPYNFLLYYEFFKELTPELKTKAENMPRQAVYVLASRQASLDEKKAVVRSYQGQTKREMLELIRETFPLSDQDKRKTSFGQKLISELTQTLHQYQKHKAEVSGNEKVILAKLVGQLLASVKE